MTCLVGYGGIRVMVGVSEGVGKGVLVVVGEIRLNISLEWNSL